jgi:capsular polysaccharide biosynthesis protein
LDFWDITQLLIRRWRVSLPLLLLTAVLTGVTFAVVKPTYVATAYVELVPPAPITTSNGASAVDIRNPWLNQGLQGLGNAAMVAVEDLSYLKTLEANGYSPKVESAMGGSSTPIVTFTINGATREQVSETADRVVNRFHDTMESLQADSGVATADFVTDLRLDTSGNVTPSHSRLKRVVLAVVGLGLVLCGGVTIAVDTAQRRRGKPQSPNDTPETAGDRPADPGSRTLAPTAGWSPYSFAMPRSASPPG